MDAIAELEKGQKKSQVPDIRPGDEVRVHNRIVEGERERVQVFQGVVMRMRKGGVRASITVRRIAAHGIGVERSFLLHSPRIERIDVLRRSKVRRAQLYYLRERQGKAARLREERLESREEEAQSEAAAESAAEATE